MVSTVLIATVVAAVLTLAAEWLHARRVRRIARLAFGPSSMPSPWTRSVPFGRAIGAGLLAWGMATLLFDIEPKIHRAPSEMNDADPRHLLLVLDVSPSMRLVDAGPERQQSRLHRGRDLLQSMFGRIAIGRYKISIIATYTGALPVVVDTTDAEVVQNVLTDLPMHYAFKAGETRLFDGLEKAAEIAKPWKTGSATLVVVSDGDTLPPTGMPKMPPSIRGSLVVGVGDPREGSFINGRNSRQDVSALRQMALRLGGTYHDGNQRQVATAVLGEITSDGERSALEKLSKREFALLASLLGALLLALMPVLLHFFGTRWQPGTAAVARDAAAGGKRPDRRTA